MINNKNIFDKVIESKKKHNTLFPLTSQPATTCSKLAIEKLEQGVKYVQS